MGRPRSHACQHQGHTYLAHRLGSTEGPQFVLVHGIGVAASYFNRLAAVLARSADVHVLELPGFGRAPRPAAPLSVPELAAVVNSYVRSAGLAAPVLVGHSMGSQIVVEAALQAPRDVHSVVGMGCVVDSRAGTAWQQGLRLLHDLLREPPSTNWAVLKDYLRTGPRWYLRTVPFMLSYRTEDSVRQLQVPLLVVRGARDPIATRRWSQQLCQAAPDARLVEVPGAAHVVMHTHPDDVAALLLTQGRGSRAAASGPGAADPR